MPRTVFVPESCISEASGFLFGVESSLISGDGYACAFLILHADSLQGNDAELNLINSFKSRCFDLLCLGFWERPSQTFKSLAYDSGKSHQIYVVFNGEALVHSKLLASPLGRGRDAGNDAIAWLFDVLRIDFRLGDLLQSHLRMQCQQPNSQFVQRTTLLVPTTRGDDALCTAESHREEKKETSEDVDAVNGEQLASCRAKKMFKYDATLPASPSPESTPSVLTRDSIAKLLDALRRHSAICRQLSHKWRCYRAILGRSVIEKTIDRSRYLDDENRCDHDTDPGQNEPIDMLSRSPKRDESDASFLMGNLLSIALIDVALGVTFAAIFFFAVEDEKQKVFSCQRIIASSHSVASQLRALIGWLQGVPAGLKLNKELSHFMGNFFFYHIHLWLGYVSFVKPLLCLFTSIISYLGCVGGFSSQVALVSDILSCLSLHVYCFYVYASRVFYFLFRALSSLFRLFRGKKKNPLRNRIDTCEFDFAQLFVGTLVFTILLFLFPTVLLYYIVFTALRLLTLVLQLVLSAFVNVINHTPFYGIFLRLISSPYTTSGMELSVASSLKSHHLGNKTNAVFLMTFRQAPLNEVISTCQDELDKFYSPGRIRAEPTAREILGKGKPSAPNMKETPTDFGSWCKNTVTRLFRGELVEPWKQY